jgi:hypothetical protein
MRNLTREDHWYRWKALTRLSWTLGPFFTTVTLPCSNYELRPVWEFDSEIAAATSHPMLFLSNTRDPVTPLRSARRMATKFPGAVVFGQDADGHCTISQPSTCVAKGIREYFQSGKLPKGDVSCKPDVGPFDELPNFAAMSKTDRVISEAVHAIASRLKHDGPLGLSF